MDELQEIEEPIVDEQNDDVYLQVLALYAQVGQLFLQQLLSDPEGLLSEVQEAVTTLKQLTSDPVEALRKEIAELREILQGKSEHPNSNSAATETTETAEPAPSPSEAAVQEPAPATAPEKIFSPRGTRGTGIARNGRSLAQIMGLK